MASMKADRPLGSQPGGQVKKEPAKATQCTPKATQCTSGATQCTLKASPPTPTPTVAPTLAPTPTPAPKKVPQKLREPKTKAKGVKLAPKN
ncbi:hypothetical protein HHK36_015064 [Tetracentron sinense]|uniref:Uncharacterized protein n=1 Tax=Tetracentron sinense TaxID=13715 RepID=A0A835DGD2_TETSI|nr:hypothetical protein HHK36_015064 [Tetracentron sinense]